MLECDYLVIGAGASGMIFVDELLTHTNADIIMVDRQARPGGHWNHAYPFVRLHQPSAFYGAGSLPLGANRIESSGLNAGLYEQARGIEVAAYFDRLMHERFLPSGRVRFMAATDYEGETENGGRLRSRLSGRPQDVTVRRRIVRTDAYGVRTPATHSRLFPVCRAWIVAPGDLAAKAPDSRHFAVLGGGKTSMDVILWLLEHGVAPDAITWVAPRDSWLTNRETVQPGDAHRRRMLESQLNKLTAYAAAADVDDMFDRLETAGEIFRMDPSVRPAMHYGATISPAELAALRTVRNVLRMGHVEWIDGDQVRLEQGSWTASADTLFIDCTARGLNYGRTRPVFDGRTLNVQMIRRSLVSLSAAAIAFVEAAYDTDETRNRLCRPIPYGDHLGSWIDCALVDLEVQGEWAGEPRLRAWLKDHRLMGAGIGSGRPDPELASLAQRIAAMRPAAINRLRTLAGREDPRAARLRAA